MAPIAKRPLRALFLTEALPPAAGPAARSLGALLGRYPGAEAVVSAPHRSGCGRVDRSLPVTVRRARTLVGPQGLGLKLWRTQVEWLARRVDPAVVVVCGTRGEAAIGLELHESRGIPLVLMLDGPEIAGLRAPSPAAAAQARRLVERVSAIVVPSRTAWLEAYKLHIHPHELEEIPPAVDLERFRPGQPDAALRKKLQAGKGPVLLAVAEDDPAADPETVLHAFAAVRAQLHRAVLVAVGFRDPAWRALARELRIDRAVRFLDASADDLPALHCAADLFLAAEASSRDAAPPRCGVALAEALASGLPVAGTRTPGITDFVDEGECGVLVEPGAHAKLGKTAVDLLRSDERRRELSHAARERAEARYDATLNAERLRTLLEVLLVRRLRRAPLVPLDPQVPAA